jgi:peptidoglycan/LPS O-acetylase OafA/YrhL
MQLDHPLDRDRISRADTAAATSPLATPVNARSENIPYLAGVDHLRCAAAVLIVYYHGIQLFSSNTRYHAQFHPTHWRTAPDPFSALVVEGHTAVALFMVLSGFVFAFGAADKRVAYREFLTNRFLRTYPLFLFILMLGTAVHFGTVTPLALLQTVLGAANFSGAERLGAFSNMFWSLGVEWQFYLLFPVLMALLNRGGPSRLLLLGAMVLGARVLGYQHGLDPVQGVYFQLIGRLDQFMCGMLAGWFYARNRARPLCQDLLPPAVALVLLGAWAFNRFGGWPYQHWLKLFTPSLEGVLWAVLIVGYVAVIERSNLRKTFLSRGLSAVGATSYSIYLWHFVFIDIQRAKGWVPQWLAQHELNAALVLTVTTLPAILVFSALSYKAVEEPFLGLRKRYLAVGTASAAEASVVPAVH